MPDDLAPALIGAALIKDEVSRLPDRPGVYRMFGEDGEALYVGKAKSLKKRVIQYAQGRFHTQRIALMVDLTRSMEFTTVKTETDALLLEINLIKALKPRFNVLLRDDKSFPEIVIRREHPAAQLKKHRGAHSIKGDYFGPFASAWAVNRTLNTLQKAFLLRSCSDSVYESRTRPCMLHQIRRCSAPCPSAAPTRNAVSPGCVSATCTPAMGRGATSRLSHVATRGMAHAPCSASVCWRRKYSVMTRTSSVGSPARFRAPRISATSAPGSRATACSAAVASRSDGSMRAAIFRASSRCRRPRRRSTRTCRRCSSMAS